MRNRSIKKGRCAYVAENRTLSRRRLLNHLISAKKNRLRIAILSAFAVLAFMISSNFVGRSIGSVEGSAPFPIVVDNEKVGFLDSNLLHHLVEHRRFYFRRWCNSEDVGVASGRNLR